MIKIGFTLCIILIISIVLGFITKNILFAWIVAGCNISLLLLCIKMMFVLSIK